MAVQQRRLILITGATRGLGRALTDKFIALGHTVLGCGRSRGNIDDLRRSFGPPHSFEMVNVADSEAVHRWASRVLGSHGPPDLLINNAGLINNNAPLWQVPTEEFDQIIDVNIKGVANVLREFVPSMAARKKGIIVNFSSGWGRTVAAEVAPYCTTKWAVEGLTQALAEELPSGMAAVPLNPGIIDTDMLRTCMGGRASKYQDAAEWAEKAVPMILKLGPRDNGKQLSVS